MKDRRKYRGGPPVLRIYSAAEKRAAREAFSAAASRLSAALRTGTLLAVQEARKQFEAASARYLAMH